MDNFLLLLFALPLATIIISSVFELIIKNPIAIGALAFAVYLIVTFAAFDATFLIYAILYTILAFISAFLTRAISNLIQEDEEEEEEESSNNASNNIVANGNGCSCGCRRYRF